MKWAAIWSRIRSRPIIIYADFIDPFCYIGFHNLRRAAEAQNIPLTWRGFELNPDTPLEGAHLVTAVNSDLRPAMWASVEGFAKKSGLTLAEPTQVPNTRLAHLWLLNVQNRDVKNSLIERIYQAYLSDKMDIGNLEILLSIAKEFRLPDKPLRALLGARAAAPLEAFRQEALRHRFPGMPGFVYQRKTYFGAMSEETWEKMMREQPCSTK